MGRSIHAVALLLRIDSYDPHTFDPVYYFGREPVPEELYENNQFDFTVPYLGQALPVSLGCHGNPRNSKINRRDVQLNVSTHGFERKGKTYKTVRLHVDCTMALFRDTYRVESARLETWDYSWPGWYYVTIVTKNRECTFGEIVNDAAALSRLGLTADECWKQISQHHKGVDIDDYVIMPNHIHGIIILHDVAEDRPRRDVQSIANDSSVGDVQLNVSTQGVNEYFERISPKKRSLAVVVRTFKAAVTTWARGNGYPDFVWQQRFYDHVIRNQADLNRIREYIANNPLRWALDEDNPKNIENNS